MSTPRGSGRCCSDPPLAFLAAFFVWPVVNIIGEGLRGDGRWDLSGVADVLGDPALRAVAWFTLWQAAASTTLTLVVALPAAHVFARYEFRGRRALQALITVPFVLPTVVVGAAFLALLGPRGPLGVDLDGTIWAILLAHVFFNHAVVVRTVGGLWEDLDPRTEEAARLLGASRWRAVREVTLPALRPAIATAAAITFLFTFTSFGVVRILGGPHHATLEVEIYRQTADLLDLPVASVLALLQLVAVGALLVLQDRLERRRVTAAVAMAPPRRHQPTTRGERWWLRANLAALALLLLHASARARRAVLPHGDRAWPGRMAGARRPLADDRPLRPAAGGGRQLVAVRGRGHRRGRRARRAGGGRADPPARAGCPCDRRHAAPARSAPRRSPSASASSSPSTAPIDLRASPWLVPLAQAVVALPFVVRTMTPVLRSIDNRLREAAAVLGAPPRRVWREVDLPLVRRALLVAAGFAFAISLGEFGATTVIARADTPTVPVAIDRLLGRPGSAQRRPGLRPERGADGAHRRGGPGRRPRPGVRVAAAEPGGWL